MDVFYALAEPTRRNIVELLALNGQLAASDISKKFPVSAPAISQHLKVLRDAKVVTVQKQAQRRIYQINPAKMQELETWIHKLTKKWDQRFDALDKVLAAEKSTLEK